MAEYDKNNQELMKYFVESCRKGWVIWDIYAIK
jgi:hypothetical protein